MSVGHVIMFIVFVVAIFIVSDYCFDITQLGKLLKVKIKTSDKYIKWENKRAAKRLGMKYEDVEYYRIVYDMAYYALRENRKTYMYTLVEDEFPKFTSYAIYKSPKWGQRVATNLLNDYLIIEEQNKGRNSVKNNTKRTFSPRSACFDGIKDSIKKTRVSIYLLYGY